MRKVVLDSAMREGTIVRLPCDEVQNLEPQEHGMRLRCGPNKFQPKGQD